MRWKGVQRRRFPRSKTSPTPSYFLGLWSKPFKFEGKSENLARLEVIISKKQINLKKKPINAYD